MRTWAHGVMTELGALAPLGPVTGNAAYPLGNRAGIVSCDGKFGEENHGPFSACDVGIAAPAGWDDVTFVLRGRLGTAWCELDVRTVADTERAIWTPDGPNVGPAGRVSGLLFSYRGDHFDEFTVEAWPTSNAHNPATVSMRLWRHESENVVEPYAPNHDEVEGTSTVPNGAGVTQVIAAPTSGRRIFLTELSITHSDPAPPILCNLVEMTAAGPNVSRRVYQVGAAGLWPDFVKPIPFLPGSAVGWIALNASHTATINLGGFVR